MEMKRIFCMVLSLMMLFTLVSPASVFAEEFEMFDEQFVYDDGFSDSWADDSFFEEQFDTYEGFDTYEEDQFFDEMQQSDEELFFEDIESESFDAPYYEDEQTEEVLDDENEPTQEEQTQEEAVLTLSDVSEFESAEPTVVATSDKEKAEIGETVNITAVATGMTGTVSYQWQKSSNEVDWRNMGTKIDTLTFDASLSFLKLYYRCAVTDSTGTYYSNIVHVLENKAEPAVTATADKAEAEIGEAVAITAVASNMTGTVSYQWQKSSNQVDWRNMGTKIDTLTFDASLSFLKLYYRCAVTDSTGTYYSNIVHVLEKKAAPVVTATADKTEAALDEAVAITAVASNMTGTVSYQWQKSSNEVDWKNMGTKIDTLTFDASLSFLKLYYRCAVTDSTGTYYSNTVHITLKTNAEVTAVSDKTEAAVGQTVTLKATTKDTVGTLTYQWQKSSNGETWVKTGLTGSKTDTMTFSATEALLKLYYRCSVTDEAGTWYSNPVHIALKPNPEIDGVVYEAITADTCRILSCSSTASTLVIPSTVEGMTVIEVGPNAFMGNETLVSIDLPDTIQYIRARAFMGCTNLREMK